jgi:hypothetical protein
MLKERAMTTIAPCFYTKDIINTIDSLIDCGYDSVDDISVADSDKLLVHCLDALGSDAYECLIDDDFSPILTLLKKTTLSRSKEDALDLADMMNHVAKEHFKDDLNGLFAERRVIFDKESLFEIYQQSQQEWRQQA